MVTVGEPIEPEVWRWYYDSVGKKRVGHRRYVVADRDRRVPLQHEAGIAADEAGQRRTGHARDLSRSSSTSSATSCRRARRPGNICIRNPWPGIFQTIWRDPERFVKTYYAKYCKDTNSKDWRDWPYFAGDGALLAEDGYFRILGRVDDVINVAGHRLGTKELESACLTVSSVAEAAVVPVVDEAEGPRPRGLHLAQAGHRAPARRSKTP